jgi:hypothetical protein
MLPMHTGLRCPMCGAMNPVQNAYCDQCNARIVPMTVPSAEESEGEQPAIRGVSLPTIPFDEKPSTAEPVEAEPPEGAIETEEANGWLAQLRDSAGEDEMGTLPTGEEEGAEDWLTQLRDSSAEPAEEPAEEPAREPEEEGAAGDWLAQLRDSAAEEEIAAAPEPEATVEPTEPVEMPDWLRDLGPVGVAEPPAETTPEPAPSPAEKAAPEPAAEMPAPAEVPEWLQELAPAEPAPSPAEEAAPEPAAEMPAPAEVPEWLQELAPAEPAPSPAEEAAPEPAAEMPAPAEVPEWLQELAPAEPAPSPAEEAAPEPAAEMPAPAEVPEWLQELAPAEPAPSPAEEAAPEPAAEMPVPAEVPEWLQDLAPASPPPFVGEIQPTDAETPEWLVEAKAEAPPVPGDVTPPFAIEPDTAAAEAAGLARAEIPAWLEAMRPSAEVAEETVEEEPVETEGLLEGLRGVLAPLPMVDVARARESASPAQVSDATLARAQLLQSLLTRPGEAPQPKPRKRTAGAEELVPRLLIAAVLFIVVAGILLRQYVDIGYDIPALTQPDASSVEDMYNLVEGVNGTEAVLIAFEYGPTQADELNRVAEPVLEHLAERGASIFIASTQPEGLAVAQALRNSINSQDGVVSGTQAALEYDDKSPGYRPGNASGVAQLLAGVDPSPSLIIVLAARPEPLRWWIEQTEAHFRDDPPPIAAGVSAALEIAASPYLDAKADQLKGIVSGLGGAAAYEAQRGMVEETTCQLDALAAGHLIIVISMLAGAAIYAVGGSRRRGKQ